MNTHTLKVERIARQLRERKPGRPVALRKKSVSHQVPKAFDPKYRADKIDVSDLDSILEIDAERGICVAEPGVTFVDLVRATLPLGWVPIVVPELKTITLGGAVAGCSIESMSFKHGGFHDTCLEYELITARGEVLTCRPDNEHRLVFEMVHGTFGTLGVLSKLKFRLVRAKPYVHLVYERHATLESYQASIRAHYDKQDVDFMDGIIHSPALYVLSVGHFVDRAPYANRYDWMKIYYLSTARRSEDFLKTEHYFFRYDKGVTNVQPRSFLGRLVLGKFFGSSELLRLAERLHWLLPRKRPAVTLDVFIPSSKVPEFLRWYERELGHFPLWCVPYRIPRHYDWISPSLAKSTSERLFLDLAIYGMPQPEGKNVYRMLEEKLLELGAIKTLISHNYYTEQEFWSVWDRENYARAKAIADPDNLFRDLYAKMCPSKAA